ncbi:MAG: hypothetical protein ACLPVY_21045 [Acidimicrobiia bacterium]
MRATRPRGRGADDRTELHCTVEYSIVDSAARTRVSTFGYEVVRLTEEREHRAAALTLALSVVVPDLVAGLGLALASP